MLRKEKKIIKNGWKKIIWTWTQWPKGKKMWELDLIS